MKISSINNYSPIPSASMQQKQAKYSNTTDTVSFSGLKSKGNECLFVFDLDGTFIEGSNEDIKEILMLQKEKQAILTYATGQTLTDFAECQKKLKGKGVILPTPKYLISNNGQFVYENINGKLVQDMNWTHELEMKTNFNRDEIGKTIKSIGQKPEYKFDENTFKKLKRRPDFQERKKIDRDFWNSKISYYEWRASPYMLEYIVSPNTDLDKLQKTIEDNLKSQGRNVKFISNKFDKTIVNECPKNILLKCRPFREDSEGAVTALFVCAADKADGVEYVKNKLKIPDSEILKAGNDTNDISLAESTKSGSFFICVSNAAEKLKEYVIKLKNNAENEFPDNLINVKKPGASGIIEGINTI